jgi:hypothetical protein
MSDPRIVGAKFVLQRLLPGATVSEKSLSSKDFEAFHAGHTFNDRLNFGTILDGSKIFLWQRYSNGRVLEFRVDRSPIEITKRERSILMAFEKTQRGLFSSDDSRAAETSSRVASYGSFGNILISRFLRSYHAANFWTPNLILSELQTLSLQSYEGSPCTSGVLFVSDPMVVLRKLDSNIYRFEEISAEHRFDVGFFSLPPSFRYVDGKNAFYVVDNSRKVRGVVRLRDPSRYSIYDRATYKHLDSIFEIPAGRMFVANVGNHGSVTVHSRNKLQLRWQQLFWSVTDKPLIVEIFQSFGLDEISAEGLTSCLLAISDMRFGALVLIASDKDKLPVAAGDIGNVGISSVLKQMARGKNFNDVVKSNEALGILTSDGLTTISRSGTILGAGEIIDLQAGSSGQISGGGRTQAAVSASRFGLAIKVSEDGPITIFKDGILQMKFVR